MKLVFLLLFLGTAVAEEPKAVQTHELYNGCKLALKSADNNGSYANAKDAQYGSYCTGYLLGFLDGFTFDPIGVYQNPNQ